MFAFTPWNMKSRLNVRGEQTEQTEQADLRESRAMLALAMPSDRLEDKVNTENKEASEFPYII